MQIMKRLPWQRRNYGATDASIEVRLVVYEVCPVGPSCLYVNFIDQPVRLSTRLKARSVEREKKRKHDLWDLWVMSTMRSLHGILNPTPASAQPCSPGSRALTRGMNIAKLMRPGTVQTAHGGASTYLYSMSWTTTQRVKLRELRNGQFRDAY